MKIENVLPQSDDLAPPQRTGVSSVDSTTKQRQVGCHHAMPKGKELFIVIAKNAVATSFTIR